MREGFPIKQFRAFLFPFYLHNLREHYVAPNCIFMQLIKLIKIFKYFSRGKLSLFPQAIVKAGVKLAYVNCKAGCYKSI